MNELTHAQLKKQLLYYPEAGIFVWRQPTSNRVSAGDVAGFMKDQGYCVIGVAGKEYRAHRLAWLYVYGEWPDGDIDHINGVRDDNRIDNLRVAKSQSEQQQNQKTYSSNTSGHPGVSWDSERGKWQSKITSRGKQHHLGRFKAFDEAALAYREAKKRLHRFCPEIRGVDMELL